MDRINSDNFNINLSNSALNSNSNNNIAQLSIDPLGVNPLTNSNFNVQTEVLDLDTVDEVSLEDKVTEKNINAMIKLINDDYDEQKKNYEEIKKYGETEKNNLDNKFNNLLNPNQSTYQGAPEQEAGTSKEIKEKITTIETETGEKYKDLNDFFTKYNESKKQDQVNDNMIAPGESGTDIYQNKVSAMTKFVKENFGFDKVEDFEKYYNEINNTISSTKQAIDFIEHCKQTTKYDLMTKLDDYQNYETPKINKEDFLYNQTGADGTNQITYNGNGCPLDALKVFKENYQGNLNGIDSKIYDLYEASQANPELGKLYSYIYNTKGKEAAAEYLEIMEDDINKIEGQKQAAEFLNSLNKKDNADALDAISNHLKVSGKGLVDGVDSYFDGLAAWLSTSNQRTADDYEKMYIMQALMSQSDKENAGLINLDEGKYKNNSQTPGVIEKYQIDYTEDYAGKFLGDNYQISQSIGNMLPSILMSTVSPVAGTVSMGVSAGGNSYHQALVEGYSVGRSLFYAVVSGSSEALLEKFMGGIPGLSDVKVTSFKTFAQAVVKEGIEEGSQEYIDALARAGILKEGIDLSETTKNAIKSGIYGMITAGIMNSGSLATNSIKNIKNNKSNTSINTNVVKKINSKIDASIYFNDPKQFIYNKLDALAIKYPNDTALLQKINDTKQLLKKSVSNVSESEMYNTFYKYLDKNDQSIIDKMYKNGTASQIYNDTQKKLIEAYTKYGGPAITAYMRKADTTFSNYTMYGTNKKWVDNYVERSILSTHSSLKGLEKYTDVDSFIKAMDKIINTAPPLKENITVYRSAESLFMNGNKINTFSIGQKFNDKAFVSTSAVPTNMSSSGSILLEIEVPKGSKAAYIESFTGVGNYGQQEILLGKNSNFEVVDFPQYNPKTGQTTLKVKLISQ